MRCSRLTLLVVASSVCSSTWAQQTPRPATSAASDPQAVAVVQAAITALGGATAISQTQSWTFQAQMQGPHANGTVSYVVSTDTDTGKVMHKDGTLKPAALIQSHFLPALVGAILLKESQDPEFSMQLVGTPTVDGKPVTIVSVMIGRLGLLAQTWSFDSANLPSRIDFRLPAEIGARRSVHGLVELSDYQAVSGVLYPLRIVSSLPGRPPEIVTIQSVNGSATAPPNEYRGEAGDL